MPIYSWASARSIAVIIVAIPREDDDATICRNAVCLRSGASCDDWRCTGQLTRTGAAQITFAGPLYVTTGPYFGGPFNPGAVGARQVGTMTFVLTTVTSGQLRYSVDGVVVTKAVQRQPLTLDNYSGNYTATVTATTSGCINPADNEKSRVRDDLLPIAPKKAAPSAPPFFSTFRRTSRL